MNKLFYDTGIVLTYSDLHNRILSVLTADAN